MSGDLICRHGNHSSLCNLCSGEYINIASGIAMTYGKSGAYNVELSAPKPIATINPDNPKYYLLVMDLPEDKPVLIRLGDKEYVGTREMIFDTIGNALTANGFSEIIIPKRSKNE